MKTTLISVYDKRQVNPNLETALGFATVKIFIATI